MSMEDQGIHEQKGQEPVTESTDDYFTLKYERCSWVYLWKESIDKQKIIFNFKQMAVHP